MGGSSNFYGVRTDGNRKYYRKDDTNGPLYGLLNAGSDKYKKAVKENTGAAAMQKKWKELSISERYNWDRFATRNGYDSARDAFNQYNGEYPSSARNYADGKSTKAMREELGV